MKFITKSVYTFIICLMFTIVAFSQNQKLYIEHDTVFHISENTTFSINIETIEGIINSVEYANAKNELSKLKEDKNDQKNEDKTILSSKLISEGAARNKFNKEINTLIESYLYLDLNLRIRSLRMSLIGREFNLLHGNISWNYERDQLQVVFFLEIKTADDNFEEYRAISTNGRIITERVN